MLLEYTFHTFAPKKSVHNFGLKKEVNNRT